MLRIFDRIRRTGKLTEPLPEVDSRIAELGAACQREIARSFGRSLAIRMVDAGSCNGCELEMHAVNNSFYDIEQFGIHFVASPRHADLLLVTGVVSRHMEEALRRTYAATPAPKLVVAMGDCAGCGGEFGSSYASCGAVANVIPVDAVIPGCPPGPAQLLRGLLELLQRTA
ncbi:Ni,Fe-hydrogenase III small subunit [Geothermobacter ehrlichii]|uniref:Ni,Fe-hydrogenase III small subunit n=1 Tax=Geothermobacter ehrlichii TaxID=213224 RepID=A0A5D3WNL0_9BACT|nr:NADH-quinone oxidoreductase subunit NuoB [Geothermobacter ehrlichii]TYP00115.1 Ni,Fe-hydrogenase III small subunit [Geothermobacter ehrlichii]